MLDVAALGELLIDFTCLSTDEKRLSDHGGASRRRSGKLLAALAKYGAKTAMLGKVGTIPLGGSCSIRCGARASKRAA